MKTLPNRLRPPRSRALCVLCAMLLALACVLSPWLGGTRALARPVGEKNPEAREHADAVSKGQAPSYRDYSTHAVDSSALDDGRSGLSYGADGYATTASPYETLQGGAVFRGGNSKSGLQDPQRFFDNDPNDYAGVLPYGNVYIDPKALNWGNGRNFIIDIDNSSLTSGKFVWIASQRFADLEDAAGHVVDTDPMGNGGGVASSTNGGDLYPSIAYLGPVKGYLDDGTADYYYRETSKDNGITNVFEAPAGSYLYRITYLGAATLPDGTKGNLVISVPRVELETTLTDDDFLVAFQTATSIMVKAELADAQSGQYINTTEVIAKTADEVRSQQMGPDGATNRWGDNANNDKYVRTATGAIIDLEIKVTDVAGHPVEGTILYAANDLDLDNYQDLWGHPFSLDGEERYRYNEGMSILSGSQSYAVTPYYDHANGDELETGWIPVNPTRSDGMDSPLHIRKVGSGGSHADGVHFTATSIKKIRDKNNSFADALFNYGTPDASTGEYKGEMRTVLGQPISTIGYQYKDVARETIQYGENVIKALLWGKIKDGAGADVKPADMTMTQIVNCVGAGSFATTRGNDAASCDTGFAVLLDASGSKLQWSGSMTNIGSVITNLFDTTLFTSVNQSHGTGGGIYLETYDTEHDLAPIRNEGTVAVPQGSNATCTLVPEDGYVVCEIRVDGKLLTVSANGAALTLPDGTTQTFSGGKATLTADALGLTGLDSVTIEQNQDGTYDVTLQNVTAIHGVHVDFDATYYFQKVWKGSDKLADLKMTATPFVFAWQDVTLDGTKYAISGDTFTDPDGHEYVLDNGYLFVGAKTYRLVGDDLFEVDAQGRRSEQANHIRSAFVRADVGEREFTIAKSYADDAADTSVVQTKSGDATIWTITYPAAGIADKEWPALPIELEPSGGDHGETHTDRLYWFVTEEVAAGWALASYSNAGAEAPGVITTHAAQAQVSDVAGSGLSEWAILSTSDYADAHAFIQSAAANDHAYLSVFSLGSPTEHKSGGVITNVPALVVQATKAWDDYGNEYDTRKDIWLHIDATASNEQGAQSTIRDVLPPQRLSASQADNSFTLSWGNKQAYTVYGASGVDANTIVVGSSADLPRTGTLSYAIDAKNSHQFTQYDDGVATGKVYYVNELRWYTAEAKPISYALRETDGAGNDLSASGQTYLPGYTVDATDVTDTGETMAVAGGALEVFRGGFTNTNTTPPPVEGKMAMAEVKVEKVLSGREPLEGESFTLRLTPEDGAPLRAVEEGKVVTQSQLEVAATPGEEASFERLVFLSADLGGASSKDFRYRVHEICREQDGRDANPAAGGAQSAGLTYAADQIVTIRVSKVADGALAAAFVQGGEALSDVEPLVFVNTYEPEPVEVELEAAKRIVGLDGQALRGWKGSDRSWGEASFELVVEAGTDEPVPAVLTATAQAPTGEGIYGVAKFGSISFAKAGVYTYAIREVMPEGVTDVHPTHDGLAYDFASHSVRVEVADDGAGRLSATVSYGGTRDDSAGLPVFSNQVVGDDVLVLEARKAVTGANAEPGAFGFGLFEADEYYHVPEGAEPLSTATNDAEGWVRSLTQGFTVDDLEHVGEGPHQKTFYYVGREMVPEGATVGDDDLWHWGGYSYDPAEEHYAVTVTEELSGPVEVDPETGVADYRNNHVFISKLVVNDRVIFEGQTKAAADEVRWKSLETADWPVFHNAYAATGSARVSVEKRIAGTRAEWRPGDSFTFELRAGADGVPLRTAAGDAGALEITVTGPEETFFDDLVFDQDDLKNADGSYAASKTFAYVVSETASRPGGFENAGPQTVELTLANDGVGSLQVSYAYPDREGLADISDHVPLEMVNHFTQEVDPAQPLAIEKYVNRGTSASVASWDETFTYDVLVYVPTNATGIEVSDVLEPELAFADGDETAASVVAKVAGDDGKADVAAEGTPLPADAGVETKVDSQGRKLTVRIANPAGVLGQWVQVSFPARFTADYRAVVEATAASVDPASRTVPNLAKYRVATGADGLDGLDKGGSDEGGSSTVGIWTSSNTVTVTPPPSPEPSPDPSPEPTPTPTPTPSPTPSSGGTAATKRQLPATSDPFAGGAVPALLAAAVALAGGWVARRRRA